VCGELHCGLTARGVRQLGDTEIASPDGKTLLVAPMGPAQGAGGPPRVPADGADAVWRIDAAGQ
jgi:hypothetical protein